jgi:hypothetical protein
LTDAIVLEMYATLTQVASEGGPYAGIFDASRVLNSTVSAETVRNLAAKAPAVAPGTVRIVVAPNLYVYGQARMIELLRDGMDGLFHVVRALDEAYAMLGVDPDSFTQRLFTSPEASLESAGRR